MATYKINITYDAKLAQSDAPVNSASICDIFVPGSCAADMEVFDETYYDTNVKGQGFGDELDEYIAKQVAHPGIAAALRKARIDGSSWYMTTDPNMSTYMDDLSVVLKPHGFKFNWETVRDD